MSSAHGCDFMSPTGVICFCKFQARLCMLPFSRFEVRSFNASDWSYTFSHGGFQGAEGAKAGDAFYVEAVFEELDAPGEVSDIA